VWVSNPVGSILPIDATLPRNPSDVNILQLYVTPKDSEIVDVMKNVLSDPFAASAKWLALSNWVAQNIRYTGSGTYWQLPRETVQKRTGVCKEYSTLLVSLLRAAGYSADDVLVVRGTKVGESSGHVWVRIRLDVIGWQELEPQAGVFGIFAGISEVRSGWTARQVFNDVSGYVLSSVAMTPITSFGSVTQCGVSQVVHGTVLPLRYERWKT
jgi:transglutaminase-like putative cysteine protease